MKLRLISPTHRTGHHFTMHCRNKSAAFACLLLLAFWPLGGRAAEVLQKVPADALGFVVARDIGATDAEVQRLLATFQVESIGPLAFLQAAAGIGEGLETQSDLMLAVLPADDGADRPRFSVWLPVADYDRFLATLGSKPAQGITAVSIRGVDLLVARDGEWALLMDPDQREHMESMLDAGPAPPSRVAEWNEWMQANELTAVALAGGLHDLLTWAAATPLARGEAPAAGEASDALFGAEQGEERPANVQRAEREPSDAVSIARKTTRDLLSSSPKVMQWAHGLDAIGIGIAFDDGANARLSMRAAWNKDGNLSPNEGAGGATARLPPSIYGGGQFIVQGAGKLPQPLAAVCANAYSRLLIDDLKKEMGLALEPSTVERFQEAVEQAAAGVVSAGVLTLAGEENDGVYTNSFLVARAESADAFADRANEVMRLWNQMNRDADDGTRLVFDVAELSIGDRTATLYSLDVAAADGSPAIPEVRQVMEKFFGEGGKLRLIILPADDKNVIVAMATPEQVEGALKTLRLNRSEWQSGERVDQAARLLPRQADWRLFFSPHGYTTWSARQMDAMTGPVFGGPIVKDFPAAPPIGVAGGAADHELWIEAAAPADTIDGAGEYFRKKKKR